MAKIIEGGDGSGMPVVSPKLKKNEATLIIWDPSEEPNKRSINGIAWDSITDVSVVNKPANEQHSINPSQVIRFVLDADTILEVRREHGTTHDLINTLLDGHDRSLTYKVFSRERDGAAMTWITTTQDTKTRASKKFKWDPDNSCLKGVPRASSYTDDKMNTKYDWTEVEAFWREQFALLYKAITLETWVEPSWPDRRDTVLNKLKGRFGGSEASAMENAWDSVVAFVLKEVYSPNDQKEISDQLIAMYKSKGGSKPLKEFGEKQVAPKNTEPEDNIPLEPDENQEGSGSDDDLPF